MTQKDSFLSMINPGEFLATKKHAIKLNYSVVKIHFHSRKSYKSI